MDIQDCSIEHLRKKLRKAYPYINIQIFSPPSQRGDPYYGLFRVHTNYTGDGDCCFTARSEEEAIIKALDAHENGDNPQWNSNG